MKKFAAEFLGTLWLVLGGCGSAVLAANFKSEPFIGIGLVGVSFAFGLTVLTIAYSLGRISGAHLNPAVTIGLWAGGRVESSTVLPYVISQILGGIAGAGILYAIAIGNGQDVGNFAANGYDEHSPGGYNMISALLIEFIMTMFFVIIIFGSTEKDRRREGFAGIAIGLALTLIHLISIPVTNTSVNPARSISQAVFVQGWALEQLWLFIVAPIVGGMAGGAVYKNLLRKTEFTEDDLRE
ncbi:aquaporin Z [Flavobacterium sp. MAH-1]|uniref:Aquaporin Z n=1 Tax=Flavobacterium agri TaxID=2743471 RepID=A0A7Y9C600_9FLAO|nr:aquaporin Z [Flavobacterium agri]NUY80945.1 aquaporin Z [Flavobacterium agri]NYA70969.1 aquaporin Z [Flavobacterium agri]